MSIPEIIALLTFAFGIYSYMHEQCRKKKQDTLNAFSKLQVEVLDNLASVNKKNAKLIVESRYEDSKCMDAYNDYRVLIARLEHFAVGVNKGIFDIKTLNELAGSHLIYLYRKVKPIIDAANAHSNDHPYYSAFTTLYHKLLKMHPEISKSPEG